MTFQEMTLISAVLHPCSEFGASAPIATQGTDPPTASLVNTEMKVPTCQAVKVAQRAFGKPGHVQELNYDEMEEEHQDRPGIRKGIQPRARPGTNSSPSTHLPLGVCNPGSSPTGAHCGKQVL